MSNQQPYFKFTTKSRLDKAINSLLGIIQGIAVDRHINDLETRYLATWLLDHQEFAQQHPFNEILPRITTAISDGVIDDEEHENMLWFCEQFQSGLYYQRVTAEIQQLHAILAGIAADGKITENELDGLRDWLDDHEHLRTVWPYDEIDSLVTVVMKDRRIDPAENNMLLHYFSEFIDTDLPVHVPEVEHPTVQGLCAMTPVIKFEGATFCFTGESSRHTRNELVDIVSDRGGEFSKNVTRSTNYLVIGAEGNPCWAYACYGRKVEQAVKLRKQGYPIVLAHENDFFDAF